MPAAIDVEMVRAWPHGHESRRVRLANGARVRDALALAGWEALPGIAGYAIHGRRADLETTLGDGDRIELLRPLEIDPKEARRRRARGS